MENNGNGSLNEVLSAQFGDQTESTEVVENTEVEAQSEELQEEETQQQQPKEEEDVFSKRFAALSRKEKAIRQREVELETRLAEMEAKMQELNSPKEEPKPEVLPLEYRLKKNPLETLQELGLGYETLTELALNDGKLTTDMQMRLMREEIESNYNKKLEELENKLVEKERLEEEKKYNQTIQNFKDEINGFVETNNEKYELINVTNSQELVYNIISEHYQDTGRILDMEEAADAVENYLLEEARQLKAIKKLNPVEEKKPVEEKRQSPPTLSNDHSAMSQNAVDKKLSDEQSKAAIAKLLQWTE